jgi:hypothetical protein
VYPDTICNNFNAIILISGRRDTGKGSLAKLIHNWSPRAAGPFVTVDCAAHQNALKNIDKKTARIEHAAALQRVMIGLLTCHTELFKQFGNNPSFKKWLGDIILGVIYIPAGQYATGDVL